MKEHKHAVVLRALADGVPIDEFEAHNLYFREFFRPLHECFATDGISDHPAHGWITHPDKWEIRRKPQYIMVNGFKVPKPLDVMPSNGFVYIPAIDTKEMFWASAPSKNNLQLELERGILHATKEAAIAHAKAMLGIDPQWET